MRERRRRYEYPEFLDDKTTVAIQRGLASLRPFASGLNFHLDGKCINVEWCTPFPITETDEELIANYERDHHVVYGDEQERKYGRVEILRRAKRDASFRYLGGYGITSRSMETIYFELLDLEPAMEVERGKIVVLGNGFSPAPLTLAARYEQGLLTEVPVIIDVFDYEEAWDDFIRVILLLLEVGITEMEPLMEFGNVVRQIVEAKQKGLIKTIKYYVGSGHPPAEAMGANIVFNCYGPNKLSLYEQLSLLAPGGKYFYAGIDGEYSYQRPATSENN